MTAGATKVTLKNSNYFFCTKGISILDSAKGAGVILEHSCRTGKCGVCKTNVISGSTSLTLPEIALTEQETSNGIILTCCRTAESELTLNISDLGDLAKIQTLTLPSRIDSIEFVADNVVRVVLRLPPNNSFNCLPGQYINIISANGIRRSYSIANYFPSEEKIELQIRKIKDGVMGQYWFDTAKTFDLLRFDGPHGTFFFRSKKEQRIIFLATGTGIAPIKSILEQFEQNPILVKDKTIEIYWGNRTPDEFYWKPKFEAIEINFNLILSQKNTNWQGMFGYVQDAALLINSNLEDAVVYASGSPAMVDSTKSLFALKGLKEDCFFSDAFYSS